MPTKLTNLQITEVSGVDKAANGRKFIIVKRAANGKALPDGSFPIKTAKDVSDAVDDWGRAGSKESDKKHIMDRAKAIGAENKIPDSWKGGEKLDKSDKSDKLWSFVKNLFTLPDDDSETIEFNKAVDDVTALMDSEVMKIGRKISADRLDALKQVHQNLGDLIGSVDSTADGNTDDDVNIGNNVGGAGGDEDTDEGDDNVAKGKFPDGHPAGCMCDDCKKVRDAGVTKSASADVPEDVQKRMDDIEKRNKELEEKIQKQNDDLKNKEYINKAAGYQGLAVNPDEFGLVLKSLAEKDPENFAKLDGILKAADEAIVKGDLFVEKGRGGGGGETSAVARINAIANETITKGAGVTKEQAIAKAWKDNPELYKQYQKELKGGE